MRALTHFLCAKRTSNAETYRELTLVYGPTVISERKVRKGFENGSKNVHDEERSGRPSILTEIND